MLSIPQDNPEAGVPVENLVDYRDLMRTFGTGEYIISCREEAQRVLIIRI